MMQNIEKVGRNFRTDESVEGTNEMIQREFGGQRRLQSVETAVTAALSKEW
jgi:hypothetical protein